jgi:hypothetical protein
MELGGQGTNSVYALPVPPAWAALETQGPSWLLFPHLLVALGCAGVSHRPSPYVSRFNIRKA